MKIKSLLASVLLVTAAVMTTGTAHANFPLDQWDTLLFSQFTVTNGTSGVTEDVDHVFNSLLGESPYLLYNYIGTDSPASFLLSYNENPAGITNDSVLVTPGLHTVALPTGLGNHSFWLNTLDHVSAGHSEYIVTDKPGQVVPEPAAMALFAMGGLPLGLSFLRRRKA